MCKLPRHQGIYQTNTCLTVLASYLKQEQTPLMVIRAVLRKIKELVKGYVITKT